MGVKWTKDQEQVIGLRDRNLLISAAVLVAVNLLERRQKEAVKR